MNQLKNQTMNQLKNQTMNKIEEINKESEEQSIKDLKELFSLNNKSTTNWHEKISLIKY